MCIKISFARGVFKSKSDKEDGWPGPPSSPHPFTVKVTCMENQMVKVTPPSPWGIRKGVRPSVGNSKVMLSCSSLFLDRL